MLLFRKHCPGYKKTSYNNTRWNLKRTEKACLYAGQMNNSNYQWEQKKKKKGKSGWPGPRGCANGKVFITTNSSSARNVNQNVICRGFWVRWQSRNCLRGPQQRRASEKEKNRRGSFRNSGYSGGEGETQAAAQPLGKWHNSVLQKNILLQYFILLYLNTISCLCLVSQSAFIWLCSCSFIIEQFAFHFLSVCPVFIGLSPHYTFSSILT